MSSFGVDDHILLSVHECLLSASTAADVPSGSADADGQLPKKEWSGSVAESCSAEAEQCRPDGGDTCTVDSRVGSQPGGSVGHLPSATAAAAPAPLSSRPSVASLSPSCATEASGGSSSSICRICHEGGADEALLSPCHCSGSVKHVHQSCLQQWLQAGIGDTCGGGGGSSSSNGTRSNGGAATDPRRRCDRCELCGYSFVMTSHVKPFRKWKKLKMTTVERRKVLCSVTFHAVAITCVVWSLYVLIDRTTQEIQEGNLQWPFWTKLVVVAIGFTGGLVFMYVQCKMYVQLFGKWRACNRVIQVQSVSDSEKPASGAASASQSKRPSFVPGEAVAPYDDRLPV